MKNFFNSYLNSFNKLTLDVDNSKLSEAVNIILGSHKLGKKIIVIGNGGSAAIASHLSVDFTKAAGIRAINFNESSLLTCFGNDYGYENWVEYALKFYADEDDVVILISSSGKSKNILNGAKIAKLLNCKVITFSGFKKNNPLSSLGDLNFWVNSDNYNFIETTHQIWLLSIVDYIIEQSMD